MTDVMSPEGLSAGILGGDRRALSRAMSWVEDETEGVDELFRRVFPRTGGALRIGITGPPGAGKSTLVARLASMIRSRDETLGIVAVDPTSPFTGGALLGDRIRMPELAGDSGVFMRSMATRGSLGGIASATHEVMDLLDAYGVEWILVETVGVGQAELDVARLADLTVVVLVPESGDAIQAMKAGLMEIGHVFVVNKADRDGADRSVMEIEAVLALKDTGETGRIPVLRTVAVDGKGIPELLGAVENLLRERRRSGEFEASRHGTARWRLVQLAQRKLVRSLAAESAANGILEDLASRVASRELAPRDAAVRLVDSALLRGCERET